MPAAPNYIDVTSVLPDHRSTVNTTSPTLEVTVERGGDGTWNTCEVDFVTTAFGTAQTMSGMETYGTKSISNGETAQLTVDASGTKYFLWGWFVETDTGETAYPNSDSYGGIDGANHLLVETPAGIVSGHVSIQTQNGLEEVPVASPGDISSPDDALRIQTPDGIKTIPTRDTSEADFSHIRVQTPSGVVSPYTPMNADAYIYTAVRTNMDTPYSEGFLKVNDKGAIQWHHKPSSFQYYGDVDLSDYGVLFGYEDTDSNHHVIALDREGNVLFDHQLSWSKGLDFMTWGENGNHYVAGEDEVRKYASNGDLEWSMVGDTYADALAFRDGYLYVGWNNGPLEKFDSTSVEQWSVNTDTAGSGGPCVFFHRDSTDVDPFYHLDNYNLNKYDSSGNQIWSVDTEHSAGSGAVRDDGWVYFHDNYRRTHLVDSDGVKTNQGNFPLNDADYDWMGSSSPFSPHILEKDGKEMLFYKVGYDKGVNLINSFGEHLRWINLPSDFALENV